MNRDEADLIVKAWGEHLETLHAKLMTVFFLGHIPDIFLPFPAGVLLDAINTLSKFYFDMGDLKTSEVLRRTCGPVVMYTDAVDAAEHQMKIWTTVGLNPDKIMLDKLRQYGKSK